MEVKHTPGPWKYGPAGYNMRTNYCQGFTIASRGEHITLIAGCFNDVRGGEDVARANAELIAAAPDLLAALQAIVTDEGGTRSVSRDHLIAVAARAAIAKATGR